MAEIPGNDLNWLIGLGTCEEFRTKIIAVLSVWPGCWISMIGLNGLIWSQKFLSHLLGSAVGAGIVVSWSLHLGVKVEDPCET